MTATRLVDLLSPNITNNLNKYATLYGCVPCECLWANSIDCFLCGKQGAVIAEPLSKEGLDVPRPKNAVMLTANHVVRNKAIADAIKQRLQY